MPQPLRRALFIGNIDPALFEHQRERLNLIIFNRSINSEEDTLALEGIQSFLDACSGKINPTGFTAEQWRAIEANLTD